MAQGWETSVNLRISVKKYCIRQVLRIKNHVESLTEIGEGKKSGKNDKNSTDLGYHYKY